MKKIINAILLASIILSCILALTSCAPCETCHDTRMVVCDECDGAGFFKEEVYYNGINVEADVACEVCEGTGRLECPDCSSIFNQ